MLKYAVVDANSVYENAETGEQDYARATVVMAGSPGEACAEAREQGFGGLLFAAPTADQSVRVNILCDGEVIGEAIGESGNVTHTKRAGRFDRTATLEDAHAYCADFNARGFGKPIYAKPWYECKYDPPRR